MGTPLCYRVDKNQEYARHYSAYPARSTVTKRLSTKLNRKLCCTEVSLYRRRKISRRPYRQEDEPVATATVLRLYADGSEGDSY